MNDFPQFQQLVPEIRFFEISKHLNGLDLIRFSYLNKLHREVFTEKMWDIQIYRLFDKEGIPLSKKDIEDLKKIFGLTGVKLYHFLFDRIKVSTITGKDACEECFNMFRNPMIDPSKSDHTRDNIIFAVRTGAFAILEFLLRDSRLDPSSKNQEAFVQACYINDTRMIRRLLKDKRVDPSITEQFPLRQLIINNNIDAVSALLKHPKVDPSISNGVCLNHACSKGKVEIVKLLLKNPKIDPCASYNLAYLLAIENNFPDIVKLFLKDGRVDPTFDDHIAHRFVSEVGYDEILDLLIQHPKTDPIYKILKYSKKFAEKTFIVEKFPSIILL